MKKLIFLILTIFIAEITLHRCANPMSPTGGPKDTIPPTLLLSIPANQKLNFNEKEITLYFNEFISADKLKQNLIITPNSDIKYKATVKRRDLILKFETEFQDSTTYTLNFFDGITDVTERNPVPNLILAFSTTDYIDSLKVAGSVRELFTNKKSSKTTVGLYPISDTLDIFEHKPYYFVTTNDEGTFTISNIKKGKYKIISFMDENKNLKLDEATETYGFLSDTISPSTTIDSLKLFQIKLDASQLKYISARPSGQYFEARYSKPVHDYSLTKIDSAALSIPTTLTDEKDAIRFYKPSSYITESQLGYIINAWDSLGNSTIDTVYVNFVNSARKYSTFKTEWKTNSTTTIDTKTIHSINFTKPIVYSVLDTVFFKIDTIATIKLPAKNQSWNKINTKLNFTLDLSQKSYADTLTALQNEYLPDSLSTDTIRNLYYKKLLRLDPNKITLLIDSAKFISVDSDTTQALSKAVIFSDKKETGIIHITITTEEPSYFVQLMNKQGEVQSQQYNCTKCNFIDVPPGDYFVRIQIDNNQNGKWDIGNIRKMQEPEKMIYFEEKSSLRSNWEIDLEYNF
jgi:uncharacterized protein (DUF2141 family)